MLTVESAEVRFGERLALRDVSVAFPEGRVTALLGGNGAGKSTLLRAAAGLQPLHSGRVLAGGVDLRRLDRREIARRVAFLPQMSDVPFPFPAEHVVTMGRYAHLGRFQRETPRDVEVVAEAIRLVDADDFRARPVTELSGGERQRVLLARTLATEAPCVLLDEPIANLDVRHALDLLSLLGRLAAAGRTVVAAIHDLNLAYRHADHFVLLFEGEVLAEGPTAVVLRRDLVERAFGVRARLVGPSGDEHFVFEPLDANERKTA